MTFFYAILPVLAGITLLLLLLSLTYFFIQDLARKREAVERGLARLEGILGVLPDVCLVLDKDGACLETLGKPRENRPDAIAAGGTVSDVLPAVPATRILDAIRMTLASRQTQSCEFRLPASEGGADRHFEARISPLGAGSNPAFARAVVLVSRDVTVRRAMEQRLRESVEKFSTLFHLSADALITFDMDGAPQEVNAQALRLFGWGEDAFLRLNLEGLIENGTSGAFRRFMLPLLQAGITSGEESFRRADGAVFPGEFKAILLNLQGGRVIQLRIRDASLRKRLAERMRMAVKMEGIAQLARGMAHDYNNLLVGIVGGASLLRMLEENDREGLEHIADIEKAGARATGMTNRLQDLAGVGQPVREPVDMDEAIREAADMTRQSSPASVTIETSRETDRVTVSGDRAQIRRMLLNLALNARDAMPGGGRLTLRLQLVPISEGDVSRHPGCSRAGDYLCVRVTDTGVGMTPEVMARAFEPFFTTKASGQNAGLGLSTVYTLSREHGGFVEVESRPGAGSTITLYLPEGLPAPGAPAEAASRGRGRVLLVDDDPVALATTRDMLGELGYAVLSASGGQAGVDCYKERWREVDLVLLDLAMPDVDGIECFRAMKSINPNIRAILSSGYAVELREANVLEEGMLGTLQKPYTFDHLGQTIKRLCGSMTP
jgi:PAS domain S-box-containing protein